MAKSYQDVFQSRKNSGMAREYSPEPSEKDFPDLDPRHGFQRSYTPKMKKILQNVEYNSGRVLPSNTDVNPSDAERDMQTYSNIKRNSK